ncbi:HDOD domain-containing protein [Methylotenera sp.]|uniref:HDOD domain-containing protein n=1 Tax=Methylotenera sp. TaxID=2051956 RepID=UPI002720B92A|nr:HDOD domain-containing protein [Methylotenera sp.]MDO9204657.1 HDOD domain-containing protein [Methylotenera sp.]
MSSTPQELVTRDISAWIDFIRKAEIPVLKHTAREIARLKEDEDNLSARAISSAVLNDPMMVFKVLTFSQKHKGKKQLQDLVQADQAILMMGTSSFFLNLQPKVLVEDILKSNLPALMHLLRLVRRAHQAAHFAADWATHLADLHAEEVRTAALLHDLAEMLMWCFAPDKMNAIYAMQHADKTLRSVAVQQDVLGFRLQDLQKELVEIFQLPPLLSKLMQDNASSEQRVRNVILAVNLARHSANGWDDAALPDDYSDIAALLRMDIDRVMRIVGVPRIQ